jgi:Ca-activated chloride channel family protein
MTLDAHRRTFGSRHHAAPRLALVLFCIAAIGAVGGELVADGFIYVEHHHFVRPPTPVPLPRPIPPPRPQYPLRVIRHRVGIEIDNALARTRVEETFHNPNPQPIEGVYLFPLPPNASVSGFTMSMNGKPVDGEVLEREKARSIYESIVMQTRDPGLLEYVDRGLFRARVFPIPGGGSLEVAIAYDESLKGDHGQFRYQYPLDTGKYSAGEYQDVLIEARIRASAPLRNLASPSHQARIERLSEFEFKVTFEAASLAAERDFVLDWNLGGDPLSPLVLVHRDSDPEGYFMIRIEPRIDTAAAAPPKDLVLVLDSSGSMRGPKMEDARRAVKYCLNGLRPQDRFNVIDFSSEARRFRERLVEGDEANRSAALAFVDAITARGGTHVEEALRSAFDAFKGVAANESSGRLRMLCLISDGEPTLGLTRPDDLLRLARDLNAGAARLFSFGIGVEVHTILLERLALEHRGTIDYILPGEQLEVKLSNFFDKLEHPVLTDLKADFGGLGSEDVYPKPLPDVFRGESLVLVGRFRHPGTHTFLLRGFAAGKEVAFEHRLDFSTAAAARNEFVSRLWATRKVGYLLESIRLNGESRELRDEVVRLSKRHGILTPYTSYLILEDDRARPPAAAAAPAPVRDALRPLGERRDADGVEPSAAESYGALRGATGGASIGASRRLQRLKDGNADEVKTFIAERLNDRGKRVQEAAGRTFYWDGARWVDGGVEAAAFERARKVRYLSEEYFDLLRRWPAIGRILSVGSGLVFSWEGEIFEIVEGGA